MTKKKIITTAAKPKRTTKPSKEALALAQGLRPRGGHLPLALVADKLQSRSRYSRGRPVRVKPEKLAADLGLSLPQVKRALSDLVDGGLIRFVKQSRHRTRKTYGGSLYEVRKLEARLDEIHFFMQPPPRPRRAPRRPRVNIEKSMEAARADYAAYQADQTWGIARYDEDLRREVKEAAREARADEQARAFWLREEMEEFAARALAQYEVWNLPGYLSWKAALAGADDLLIDRGEFECSVLPRRGAHHEEVRVITAPGMPQVDGNLLSMTDRPTPPIHTAEEIAEAHAHEEEERIGFLATDATILAILGVPPYCDIDFAALFPDANPEFLKALREPAAGTPEAG